MAPDRATVDLLRELAPQVVGMLARRYGQWDAAEDATQEALLAASVQWPDAGVPDNPRAWLMAVASRRLIDEWRGDSARRAREEEYATLDVRGDVPLADDSLTLLFLCCHPALSQASQLALTLRAVGGLTTAEIAAAFLVPEATMAQRISRAKQQVREAGVGFSMPPDDQRGERLAVVLQVLYLVFNEGYTPGSRTVGAGADLTLEAIRLTRMLHSTLPADTEVAGLLALMLLTDARRPARELADGMLVPLGDQDRSLWKRGMIGEGVELLTATLGSGPIGPYQLQAAISAVHDEATTAGETDWPQILALYGVLERVAPGPIVTLNRSVAEAMVHGPRAGLALLATVADEPTIGRTHRYDAVRAHLLALAGDRDGAIESYRAAMRGTLSVAERRYLALTVARLKDDGSVG
jgi:RNA polymerase sigma factor (sigma-70 family)